MQRIREYETIFIMRPDISDVDADRITERMRGVIDAHEGKIIQIDNWGKRRLAYEIAKHQKGIYVYWRFIGNTELVLELERNLRMIEPVLRFLTVKLEDGVNPEAVTGLTEEQIPMRSAQDKAFADEAQTFDDESDEDDETDDIDPADEDADDEDADD